MLIYKVYLKNDQQKMSKPHTSQRLEDPVMPPDQHTTSPQLLLDLINFFGGNLDTSMEFGLVQSLQKDD